MKEFLNEKNKKHNNYLVAIAGNQFSEDNDKINNISFTTPCRFYKQNGKFYIHYREYNDNYSKKEFFYSTLTVCNDEVILTRIGKTNTELVFQNRTRHQCCYNTEFGNITLGIYTNDIFSNLTKSGGILKINYSIDVNLNFKCFNEFNLKIWETKNNVTTSS